MKIFSFIIIFLVIALSAYSAELTDSKPTGGYLIATTQTLTLDTDASGIDLDEDMTGGFLFQIEILSTLDDAMTFSINNYSGIQLFTTTTTAATGGEINSPSAYWFITQDETMNYTLSGIGSGSVTIKITILKK